MSRRVGYVVGWLVAVVAAIGVGVVTVSAIGASVTGRGPLGNEVIRIAQPTTEAAVPAEVLSPAPDEELATRTFTEEFGSLVVGCRGAYAVGVEIAANEAAGWRVVSHDAGPDDDVEAVFSTDSRSAEIEIFCNRGVPTVAEIDYDDDPDDGPEDPDDD